MNGGNTMELKKNSLTEVRISVPHSLRNDEVEDLLKKYFTGCSLEMKKDPETRIRYFIVIGKGSLISDIEKIFSISVLQ